MATFTLPSYTDPAPARRQAGAHTPFTTFTFSAALAANDVVRAYKLPLNATLMPSGWFIETSADFDTSTNLTLTLRVTDGTTTKTVILASTVGQGAAARVTQDVGNGSLQVGWLGFKTTSSDFRVELLVAAGPSTATSGSIIIGCGYTLDSSV